MTDFSHTRRKIESFSIYSAHLREDRTMKIFLPDGYDPTQPYDILYCHDGLEFFTHGRIATISAGMIAAGEIRPLVIVGIEVSRSHRNDDYGLGALRNDAYCNFTAQECIPAVEQHFLPAGVRRRFMAGISLGATVTLELFLRRRDLFHGLLVFSGAFYEQVQQRAHQVGQLTDLSAYMTAGLQETAVDTTHGVYDFLRFNRDMAALLTERGAQISYSEADGSHLWGFWQTQIPSALRWMNDLS